jgi:hypothetical protein
MLFSERYWLGIPASLFGPSNAKAVPGKERPIAPGSFAEAQLNGID